MRGHAIIAIGAAVLATPAAAHHGWGSYDADTVLVVEAPVLELGCENPARQPDRRGPGQALACRAGAAAAHAQPRPGARDAGGGHAGAYRGLSEQGHRRRDAGGTHHRRRQDARAALSGTGREHAAGDGASVPHGTGMGAGRAGLRSGGADALIGRAVPGGGARPP